MRPLVRVVTLLLAAFPAFGPGIVAQESGAFLVRLGNDTTAVERFTRSGSSIDLLQVGRAPRLLQRHAVITLGPGESISTVDVLVTKVGAAADAPPVQHVTATFAHDSVNLEARADTSVRRMSAAVPPGAAVPIVSPWTMYDMLSMRLARTRADSLHLPMYFLGSADVSWVALRRLGRDSVDIETGFDRYHARVDKAGRLLAIRPIRGTQQFSVDRMPKLDVPAMASAFAARDQGGALGMLSPRDTVNASIGGATLWVDYGRPAKRGRVVFGGVVPWGEVWRTGANAATQFKTDKALAFGGTVVPAGMYTLWTVPTQTGWTLVINSETGQWGTEHHADKDLYRIPLTMGQTGAPVERFTISLNPDGAGGQLRLEWDRTSVSAAFTVQATGT
jgi:hypothetical protein